MNSYHKIQTVFLRDPATNHKTLLEGEFSRDCFKYLADNQWEWTEKIDGTNICVHCDGDDIRYGGRTDNAQIPTFLYDKLQDIFADKSAMRGNGKDTTLYGEGYGAKIQKCGNNYIADGVDFILFDVRIGDVWLKRTDVYDVAEKLGIKHVPVIGRGTLSEAIEYVSGEFDRSKIGMAIMEGLVMRPEVELLDRRGDRVITKLKAKDFSHA